MSEEIRLIIRAALAGVGLWYLMSVLRRRRPTNHEVVATRPAASTPPQTSGTPVTTVRDPLVLAARWESVRTWSTRIAIGLFALVAVFLALAAPVSIIGALLIGVGISMAVYLVASAASGWYEGRSQQ
jgi:hypothetical protein